MKLGYDSIDSPIGEVRYAFSDDGVCGLAFGEGWAKIRRALERRLGKFELSATPLGPVNTALRAYFDGNLTALDDLPVDGGGTPFQREVWRALRRIPAGTTVSYGELAASLGRAGSQRAVAGANARNPVSLIVPCHRVIASDGGLGGYGFGVTRKRWLLHHEGA